MYESELWNGQFEYSNTVTMSSKVLEMDWVYQYKVTLYYKLKEGNNLRRQCKARSNLTLELKMVIRKWISSDDKVVIETS